MRSKRPACSAPLIRSPISRLLGAPIGPVAAVLFLLRRLDRRHIGPRHAGVAPLVPGVVLAVGHHIFGPGGRKWIFRFIWRSTGHEMTLGGSELSLATARELATEASRKLAAGQNPID